MTVQNCLQGQSRISANPWLFHVGGPFEVEASHLFGYPSTHTAREFIGINDWDLKQTVGTRVSMCQGAADFVTTAKNIMDCYRRADTSAQLQDLSIECLEDSLNKEELHGIGFTLPELLVPWQINRSGKYTYHFRTKFGACHQSTHPCWGIWVPVQWSESLLPWRWNGLRRRPAACCPKCWTWTVLGHEIEQTFLTRFFPRLFFSTWKSSMLGDELPISTVFNLRPVSSDLLEGRWPASWFQRTKKKHMSAQERCWRTLPCASRFLTKASDTQVPEHLPKAGWSGCVGRVVPKICPHWDIFKSPKFQTQNSVLCS